MNMSGQHDYVGYLRQRAAAEKWLREMIAELERDGFKYNPELGCWQKNGSDVWIEG